ncbi:hypothetical protein JTB14_017576 [Gonioctena quinquepunctata]|nr:hypothetical protein JTB14_017576 [Gonioctena quinquepunctata]
MVLEKWFSDNQHITGVQKVQLATSLNLPPNQVRIWFQKRRMRERIMAIQQRTTSPNILRSSLTKSGNQHLTGLQKVQLAISLNLSPNQVKIWFQNRGMEERRMAIQQRTSSPNILQSIHNKIFIFKYGK